MASLKNYYHILGIPNNASPQQVKAAYRTLARKYRPDINTDPNTHDIFVQINEAYEILSDPRKRADYDSQFKGVSYSKSGQGTATVTFSHTVQQETPVSVKDADDNYDELDRKINAIKNPWIRISLHSGRFLWHLGLLVGSSYILFQMGKYFWIKYFV